MMNAFLFSDLHASSPMLDKMRDFLINNRQIGLIVFAGDAVNMGGPAEFAEEFIAVLKNINLPFFWVPGNNDFGPSYDILCTFTPSLEGRVTEAFGQKYTGVGGSPASWSSESYGGKNSVANDKIGNSIFVSHYPPSGVFNYVRSEADLSADPGVERLSSSPLVHICGHYHRQFGLAKLGRTKVVKLGALDLGYYAIMELETLNVEFFKI